MPAFHALLYGVAICALLAALTIGGQWPIVEVCGVAVALSAWVALLTRRFSRFGLLISVVLTIDLVMALFFTFFVGDQTFVSTSPIGLIVIAWLTAGMPVTLALMTGGIVAGVVRPQRT